MPIGYLASHYPAVSHTFLWREVEALRRLGVDVRTLSIHAADDEHLLTADDRQAARTTFAVLPLPATALLWAHLRAFARGPFAYVRTLAWTLGRGAPGVRSHIWQLFYFAEAIVLWLHCRKHGIRHVHAQFVDVATDVAMIVAHHGGDGWSWSMTVHGSVEFFNVEQYRLPQKLADARFACAISDFGRSQLLTMLDEDDWDKVHVVRCGVDPEVYSEPPPRPATDDFRILFVGRLLHGKGSTLLIDAVARLREQGVPAVLDMVGDGPKREAVERFAQRSGAGDHVTFLGNVGQDRIRDFYLAADVFALPSFAEGIPVVLMEAMALERPVVTTRIMGIPELVDDGVSGRLVRPARLDELVAALAEIAEAGPEGRAAMGRAGRRKVLADHDVNRSAATLRDILRASALG